MNPVTIKRKNKKIQIKINASTSFTSSSYNDYFFFCISSVIVIVEQILLVVTAAASPAVPVQVLLLLVVSSSLSVSRYSSSSSAAPLAAVSYSHPLCRSRRRLLAGSVIITAAPFLLLLFVLVSSPQGVSSLTCFSHCASAGYSHSSLSRVCRCTTSTCRAVLSPTRTILTVTPTVARSIGTLAIATSCSSRTCNKKNIFTIQPTRNIITSRTSTRFMSSLSASNNDIVPPAENSSSLSSTSIASNIKSGGNTNSDSSTAMKRIVLIGGGHAHLQVIKAFHFKARPSNWHITLIDKTTSASYSGMIPGCVSNFYTARETQIPLDELAEWAKVEFLHDTVIGMNPETQTISLKNGHHDVKEIQYDVASIDIGSTSRGLDIPGVYEYTIPTRPIDLLVKKIQQASDQLRQQDETKVVVVGGGASGIELAMGLRARFGKLVNKLEVAILDSGTKLLPRESPACQDALKDVLQQRHIQVKHNCRVMCVKKDGIQLHDGTMVPFTHCIWATGAAPHLSLINQFKSVGLSINESGWIEVGPTLQSKSHTNIFAAGDCATIQGLVDKSTGKVRSSPSKAGVYAVRAGPILIENISRLLTNQSLIDYDPQGDFLKLLMCGDGTGLGFRFGLPLRGKWVWELKNNIDSMFMDLFQVKNLPNLDELGDNVEGKYDSSQYDEYVIDHAQMPPDNAAQFLMRTDDDVDYQQAWRILRDMMADDKYKCQVISFVTGERDK